jgi:hypothetical protein
MNHYLVPFAALVLGTLPAQAPDRPPSRPPSAEAGNIPPALRGVFDGKVATYRHPEGYFSLDLPIGWTQANLTEAGVLFNPGLKATDTLDCLLVVTFGELEENERGVAINELLDRQEAELRRDMQAQQIALQPPKGKSDKVLVVDLPGAELTWQGRAGGHPVTVWVGAIAVREYYLAVVAVIVQGQEERFLPGCKRMFRSLQPKPPQRDRASEAALIGGEFAHSSMYSGGSTTRVYTFRRNGTVHRRSMMSSSSGFDVGSDASSVGSYEVVGPVVYLRFKDGQEIARIERSGGAVVGLTMGRTRYQRS